MLKIDEITSFYQECKNKYSPMTIEEFKGLSAIIQKNYDGNCKEEHSLIVVVDLINQKPKYGELIHTFQTCIALKILKVSIKVYLFMPNSGTKMYWKKLITHDTVMQGLFKDASSLATILLGEFDIKHKVVSDPEFQNKLLMQTHTKILFGTTIRKIIKYRTKKEFEGLYSNFFKLNQELLSLILVQYYDILTNHSKEWLVGDLLRKKFALKEQGTYLTTNFRYNPQRMAKNSDAKMTLRLANYFWRRYSYKTLILTCEKGQKLLNNSCEISQDAIIYGKPGSFIQESILAANTKMFYQVQGGGIGIWPLFSKNIPYIFICDPGCLVCFNQKSLHPISNHTTQEYYSILDATVKNIFWGRMKLFAKTILQEEGKFE